MLPFGREFATARRGATAATDMLSVVVTDFVGVPESATFTVKFELPAVVGVPLIGPVAFEEGNRAVPFICYRKIEVAITVKIRQHNGTQRVSHGVGRADRFFEQQISTAVKCTEQDR